MIKIGELIRTYREQQGISQEILSHGICSVSSLSRIENGIQTPSRATFEAFMERMGLPAELYPSFQNYREVEAFQLKHEINQKLIADRNDEAEILLNKLRAMPELDRKCTQFIMFAQAVLFRQRNGKPEEVLKALREAAKLSIRDTAPDKFTQQLLSTDELYLMNYLAIAYFDNGMQQEGINTLYALKEYIERKVIDKKGIAPLYTTILFNLSKWLGLESYYDETIKLSETGIQHCIEYGTYFVFAQLLFNKGYALLMLGQKQEAKEYMLQAYYIQKARGKLDACNAYYEFTIKHNIDLFSGNSHC